MKPKSILYDSVFEKRWHKYLTGLTEKQKEQLKERLTIFKEDIFDKRLKTHRPLSVYFIEVGSHDVCY